MATARPLENILFLAIQTVPQQESLQELPSRIREAWQHKALLLQQGEEELSPEELYRKKAGLFAEFGKIVNIAVAYFHQASKEGEPELRVKSLSSADNEKSLLESFKNLLNERFDQAKLRLCAHNGKEFDFPYLCRRMLLHCVPIPAALDFAGKKPWEVPHLDTMEMWMFGNRKHFVSLSLLAAIFDIPAREPALNGAEIGTIFYDDKALEKITAHGQQDVITTAQLYMRYRCSPLLKEGQISLV